MKNNSFYTKLELKKLGFKKIGNDCLISKFANFYDISKISIGNNVRIDDFSILSGDIVLKNNIHISAYSALYGGGGILIEDYCGISPRSTLLSVSDDFSGDSLIGPMVNKELTNVFKKKIILNKFVQIGAGTTVLPGVVFGEGSVIGAMSLVNRSTEEWYMYWGIPVVKKLKRKKNLLKLI